MSTRNLLTFNAVFAFLTTVVLIFSPATLAGVFGVDAAPGTLLIIQLFGSGLVGYAFTSWWMRGAGASEARTAFLKAGGVGYGVVSLVGAYTVANGPGSPGLWAGVAFVFLYAVLFFYTGMRSTE